MTRALILGATALTVSAAVASTQAGYVTNSAGNVVGRPVYVAPPTPVYEPPRVVSGYGQQPVAPPVYDYAPGPTMKWVTAPKPVEQQQKVKEEHR